MQQSPDRHTPVQHQSCPAWRSSVQEPELALKPTARVLCPQSSRHCCVGRKWDAMPAPGEALPVGKHTTGVYSTLAKSPILRLAAARKVPRRRNATVPGVPSVGLRRSDTNSGTCQMPTAIRRAPGTAPIGVDLDILEDRPIRNSRSDTARSGAARSGCRGRGFAHAPAASVPFASGQEGAIFVERRSGRLWTAPPFAGEPERRTLRRRVEKQAHRPRHVRSCAIPCALVRLRHPAPVRDRQPRRRGTRASSIRMMQPADRCRASRSSRLTAFSLLIVMVSSIAAACSGGSSSHPSSAAPTTVGASSTTSQPSSAGPQRQEAPLPVPLQELAATVASDHVYAIGGYDEARNSSAAVFVFDGSRWTSGPSLPVALNHPAAATIGRGVYVAGGFTASGATNRAFVLSPGSPGWRELPPMRQARGALALASLGGRLYAIGGRNGDVQIATPEVYAPATCGCRKLVRTADLRLCPSGGHGLTGLGNCAIHPNHPVGDVPGTPRDRLTAEPRDRTVLAYSRFERSARSSGPRASFRADGRLRQDPIASRETPAQPARTGFRHPHVNT
jgi:Kelch motif